MELAAADAPARRPPRSPRSTPSSGPTDRRRLGCLEPDLAAPGGRATSTSRSPWSQVLEEQGHTYVIDDGVYFDVSTFPRYAEFARLDLDELATSGRVEHVEAKRHPADFALWKLTPAGRAAPAGVGLAVGPRLPGLAHRVLGHGHQVPGRALRHPHRRRRPHPRPPHQRGGPERVRARRAPVGADWMHNEFLDLGGEKISKSKGHVLVVDTLVERGHRPAGLPLLLPPGPLPPAAGLHLGGDRGGRHRATGGWSATPSPRADAGGEPDPAAVEPHLAPVLVGAGRRPQRAAGAGRGVGRGRATPTSPPADRWAFLADADRALGFGLADAAAPDADESGSDPRIDALVAERAGRPGRQGLRHLRPDPRRAGRRGHRARRHARPAPPGAAADGPKRNHLTRRYASTAPASEVGRMGHAESKALRSHDDPDDGRLGPELVTLSDARATDVSLTGSKAAALATASVAGVSTLPGRGAHDGVHGGRRRRPCRNGRSTRRLRRAFELAGGDEHALVARSSSVVEDTAGSSMAGQFDSVIGIVGLRRLRRRGADRPRLAGARRRGRRPRSPCWSSR